MKKFAIFLSILLFMGNLVAFAQTKTLTGTVTSADDEMPIPGVSVAVKGTTLGTVTNIDGVYELKAPEDAKTLILSFVGMKTQEITIGSSTSIDVVMQPDVLGLDEVVVTALGQSREKKGLAYAVQDIEGEELMTAREANVVNSLQGKLSGVQITNTSGNVGAGSRIVVRGMSTLTGNNMPLFVVDGVPIINSYSSVGAYSGTDYGNSSADINPADIETISILKGANAAALYGSRAVNGVVLITTKNGKSGKKGLGVSIQQNMMWSNPLKLPDFQDLYGQGYDGEFEYVDGNWGGVNDGIDESWGPRLDGRLIPQFDSPYDPVTGERTPTPWVAHPDNIKNLFDTGLNSTTSIAVNRMEDDYNYRLSVSRQDQTGMIPNTDQTKNTFTLNGGLNVTDKLRVNGSASYVLTESDNIMSSGYTSAGIFQSTMQWFGRQVDTEYLKEHWQEIDPVSGRNVNWNHSYHDNPYWTLNKNTNSLNRERFMGNVNVSYDINEWMQFRAMVGTDAYSQRIKEVRAKNSHDWMDGRFDNYESFRRETTANAVLTFDKTIGDFDILGTAGTEYNHYEYRIDETHVASLIIPDLYAVSNAASPATTGMSETEHELQSVFASVNLGYKDMLYLDLTARNDWSSTLPADNNSYFYPSASLGFIFTEALGIESGILSYGKLRASYAQVGGTADAYSLLGTYNASDPFNGQPSLTYTNTLAPSGLKPQSKNSYEFGGELKFFDNRLSIDATYYNETTENQIMNIAISNTTGFSTKTINAGEIQNKGVELTLSATPVMTKDFSWDITANWATNTNLVKSLTGDLEYINLYNGSWGMTVRARVGEEYGQMWGYDIVRENETEILDSNGDVAYIKYSGKPVVGTDGRYIRSPQQTEIGNVTPDWYGGVNNAFRYKNFNMSFLVDFRWGGDQYSITDWFGSYSGIMAATAAVNDNGMNVRDAVEDGGGVKADAVYGKLVDGRVVLTDASGNESATPVANGTYVAAQTFYESDYWGKPSLSIYDAGFVKLREVIIGYTFNDIPYLRDIGVRDVNLSFVGRNLWIIYDNMPHVDPENGISAGNTSVGMNSTPIPSARTLGFDLKINF
ncbi:SusC/RagA family TonB-linked outer membrane protein [uncultured Draconibacterium sp.]|uniref:SusC/RagA family TonB-linked outer membrane protein n=1 Tax=uncultured Draconibacterium sp. TaxID=1573823 RepID=UPI0029C7BFA7|nr:SusC/RagA family TonB-linked outer membrane protein [uncultured Draconibacterium sp.]